MAKHFAGGASASLHTTITEIREFLKDKGYRPNRDLRPFLHEKLADLVQWFINSLTYFSVTRLLNLPIGANDSFWPASGQGQPE